MVPTSILTSENRDIWWKKGCINSDKGGKEKGGFRDCWTVQGEECTKEEPCTPCDHTQMNARTTNELRDLEGEYMYRQMESCRSCEKIGSGKANYDCNFVEGVGPYCKYYDCTSYIGYSNCFSRVRPCETCCSVPLRSTRDQNHNLYFYPIEPEVLPVTFSPVENTTHYVSVTVSMVSETSGVWIYYAAHYGKNDRLPSRCLSLSLSFSLFLSFFLSLFLSLMYASSFPNNN